MSDDLNHLTDYEQRSYAAADLLPAPGPAVVREHLETINLLRERRDLAEAERDAMHVEHARFAHGVQQQIDNATADKLRFKAERDELRAALTDIVRQVNDECECETAHHGGTLMRPREAYDCGCSCRVDTIARAALTPIEEQT